MRSIYTLSAMPAISLFVFITMGYYTFAFNGARQGIACAIYSLAFKALIDGKFRKYVVWVFIAFLFHKTVIIMLPAYFLCRQKFSLRFLLLIVGIGTVTALFFKKFAGIGIYISDSYAMYLEMEGTGAKLLTLFYVLLSGFFIVCRSAVPVDERKRYDCLLNMLILGSTIYVVVTYSGGYVELTRLAFYFQISAMFLWPILFKSIQFPGAPERAGTSSQTRAARAGSVSSSLGGVRLRGRGRLLSPRAKQDQGSPSLAFEVLGVGFVIGHMVYFYVFLQKMADLVPYEFNEQLIRRFT
jgi:hypothetical protein